MDLNTAREAWNAGKFTGPYYVCLEEYHPKGTVLIVVEGIEDPNMESVVVWQGEEFFRPNDFTPLKAMIIYRGEKYYLGIYDTESAADTLLETGRETAVVEIIGEIGELRPQ